MMNDCEEGMSWKCKTHGIQLFLFLPGHDIDAFPQRPPVRGQWSYWGALGGNVSSILLKIRFSRSVNRIRRHGCRDRRLGTLLSHRRHSPTLQTVRWLSSPQATASVINRKGSHVKKKPFQLQPLRLQCRTHKNIHTQNYTWAWSESTG